MILSPTQPIMNSQTWALQQCCTLANIPVLSSGNPQLNEHGKIREQEQPLTYADVPHLLGDLDLHVSAITFRPLSLVLDLGVPVVDWINYFIEWSDGCRWHG